MTPMTMKRTLAFLILALTASVTHAFAPSPINRPMGVAATSLQMAGFFDGIMKAFSNQEFAPAPAGIKASARHILVKRADDVDMLLEKLAAGSSFANLAREYSFCSSGKSGGSLGSFKPGAMVPAFDEVIFNADTPLGEVVGPVATSFGYHLIVVDKRTGI